MSGRLDAPPVLFFDEIAPEHAPLVGGKGANLGRMARAGLPVPPGFVLTTTAYGAHAVGETDVLQAAADAYRTLGGGPVAVRSSATSEDGESASFAGQQETYLDIEGEDALVDAIQRCWDSLFTERAVAYRQASGIVDADAAMAVVVQRMVAARAAGVLFTRDPTDPAARRMLVEAVPGLGESLVSGRVTPDRWSLDPDTGATLTQDIARKPVYLPPGGGAEEPVPAERQTLPCLSADDLAGLAALGRRVEAEYDAPQDIEWAIDAAGVPYLLQSRPITISADAREAVRREEIERLRERAVPDGTAWARYSVAEVLPEPLPLTWAVWRQFLSGRGGYGRMYRELGFEPSPLLDDDGVLDLIAGRPYFNLSRDALLYFPDFPQEYPFPKLKADPSLAIYPRLETNLARAPKGFVWKMAGITRRMLAAEKTLDRAADRVPDELEATHFPQVRTLAQRWHAEDLSRLSDADLLDAVESVRAALFDEFASQGLKPSVLAGLAIEKLRAALAPALGDAGARSAVDTLLAGVAAEPSCDLAGALRRLTAGALSPAEFLEGFGHRGPGEMELALPRWREAPYLLPQGGSATAAPSAGDPAPDTLPGIADVLNGKRIDIRAAEKQLQRARRFTALREASKHYLMMGYEPLRRLLLEADRRFDLKGGVFWLEPSELPALLTYEDLRPRIAERRKRRALALGLEAPRVLFSDDLEAIGRPLPPADAAETLSGTGVSPGAAEGEALILRSPDQAPPGARDFILVCPSTDPGWVPLFLRARGVVLETGGVLSHGAIVAREFGLPAVVNVGDACTRLRTGQRLRVDGASGMVWVLS